jgi:hypothetical protein
MSARGAVLTWPPAAQAAQILPQILLFCCAILTLFHHFICAPWPLINIAGRLDESVYVLGGVEWLHGRVPYRDFWDNKPPSIYLLNAMAWFLSGGLLGIWLLSAGCSFATVILFFKNCAHVYGRGPAYIASVYFFFAIFPLFVPNVVNNFVILFNLISFSIALIIILDKKRLHLGAILLGLIWAFTFLLRPNAVLTQSFVLMSITYWRCSAVSIKSGLAFLLMAGAGALLYLGPLGVYFYHQDALAAFVDCVLRFNGTYVTGRFVEHLKTLLFGIPAIAGGNLVLLSAASVWAIWSPAPDTDALRRFIARPLVLLLGLELILASASGRPFDHYFEPAILIGGILVCAFARDMADGFGAAWSQLPDRTRFAIITALSAGIMTPAVLAFIATEGATLTGKGFWFNRPVADIQTYLQSHPTAGAGFFVWGNRPGAYLLDQGNFDTKFTFVLPFLIPNYVTGGLVHDLIGELETRRPQLIFDLSEEPGVPPLSSLPLGRVHDMPPQETWAVTQTLQPLEAYIRQHYRVSDVIEDAQITVFSRIPDPQPQAIGGHNDAS